MPDSPDRIDPPGPIGPRHFRRLALIVAAGLAVLVLVTGGTLGSLYYRAKATPPAYEAVLTIPEERLDSDRRELESQITTLYSDTQTLDAWRSRLTAGQLNAWLATRLATDFPRFAEAGFTDPRVVIAPAGVTLAVRGLVGRIRGVLSLTLLPYVTEAGELALELRSAKLGRLTLPLEGVVARLNAARLDRLAPVRWSQTESRTLLLVDLDRVVDTAERDLRLTGVDLRVGEVLIRGESVAVGSDAASAETSAASP